MCERKRSLAFNTTYSFPAVFSAKIATEYGKFSHSPAVFALNTAAVNQTSAA